MAATLKVTLKAEKRQDNTHALRISVFKEGVRRYYNTGLFIKKTDWNPKGTEAKANWVRSSYYEHAHLNEQLQQLLKELRALSLQYVQLSADGLIQRYKQGEQVTQAPCFLAFFQREINRIAQAGSPRTAARRNSIYKKLFSYAGGALPIDTLDVAFLRNYFTHLQTEYGNGAETQKKELQVLSGLGKLAVQEGLLPYTQNPFPHLSFKSKPKKKDRLTPQQLSDFQTCVLPSNKPRMQDVRHSFMLQYYLHGARIGDVLELRWQDIKKERIEYVMRKNGKVKSIPRTKQVNELLQHYKGVTEYFVLPFLTSDYKAAYVDNKHKRHNQSLLLEEIKRKTALINRYLKEIAKLAKIELSISSHVARHTFSENALKKGVNIHVLKNMLNHESLKTTEIYVAGFDQEEMDAATTRMFE